MKTILPILLLLLTVERALGQEEKPMESKIISVTVFLNKAQVTREARIRVEAGKTNLVLRGLPAALDPESIQVSGKGSFTIFGIAHRQNYLNEFNTPKALVTLKDSIEVVERQVSLHNAQKEILNKEEQLLLNNQKIGGNNQNLTVAELKAMADFYRSRLSEIVSSRMKEDAAIKRSNEKLVRLRRQVQEQNELLTRNTSEIVVTVAADVPAGIDLVVNYVVANAGWSPVYDLRAINTKNPVQLSYKANVYQATGEEWKNIRLKLSTANPTLGGVKPGLVAWYLDIFQPVYRKSKALGEVSMRAPAAVMSAGDVDQEEAEEKPETVASFVNTIQTSLNTEFDIALPYTVSSSAKPTLVDIRNYEMKADYSYAAVPKLDLDAFLVADATGWEEFSLLPGEANVFFEGTFVGKSFIDPNSIRDTLTVSLGRDKRLVVKREKMKDFSSRKLIGTHERQSYAYEISVRNTKNEVAKITIEDQVPVSRNSQIEVTLVDAGGAKYESNTGKLTWQWELQPNETRKALFKFDVKSPKGSVITGWE